GQGREWETIDTTQRRLEILTADDIDALYGRPTFTPEERMYYFALSQPEQEILQEFRAVKAQVSFILQLGYFKAKHVFVPCDLAETHEDLAYILAAYFPTTSLARIIQQPEKSTGEGDFMVQMSHKTTVSQAHDAPQSIASGRPDTAHISWMDVIKRTASCQLLGAYLNGLARKPLGL